MTGVANAATVTGATAVTEAIAATVRGAAATAMKLIAERENNHGHVPARFWWWWWRRRSPAVFPAPQKLPVLRRQCAQDRLQRRQALAALRFGARQDRAKPHYRGFGEEAA